MGFFDRFRRKNIKKNTTNVEKIIYKKNMGYVEKIKIKCNNCDFVTVENKPAFESLADMMNAETTEYIPKKQLIVKCPECGEEATKTEFLAEVPIL